MLKKILYFAALMGVASALFLVYMQWPQDMLMKGATLLFVAAMAYAALKIGLEEFIYSKLKSSRQRYLLRKTTSVTVVGVAVIAALRIWIENPETLLIAYGAIGAGLAIAGQDLMKNLLAGLSLFFSTNFRTGDRIEVDGHIGDVINVGLQYTDMMEIREWVGGDLPTGRLIAIPNSKIVSSTVCNYTKDHEFIWDEFTVPVTFDSDWKKASQLIMEVTNLETAEVTKKATYEFSKLENLYYLPKHSVNPSLYVTITDSWVALTVRYVARVRERRLLMSRLNEAVLTVLQAAPDVKIATEALTVSVTKPAI